jgi:riboflavin biosynthesis pyrimidine reductase
VIETRARPADLPTRDHPFGIEPISTLLDLPSLATECRAVRGPASLIRGYDGSLEIDLQPGRPIVLANFAATIDGAVAMDRDGRSGGGDISGFSPTDQFVMGLLRALADTIVLGAGTVRASSGRQWTPGAVSPAYAADYAAVRADLGLTSQPAVVILTTTGDLDPEHPALARPASPTTVVGPRGAISHLRRRGLSPEIVLRALPERDGELDLGAAIAEFGGRVALYEGGPRLFGALLASGLVDELFLTVAPQLVGRSMAADRLGLVEGALWPSIPTWATLRSVRLAGSHLFLRYRLPRREVPRE